MKDMQNYCRKCGIIISLPCSVRLQATYTDGLVCKKMSVMFDFSDLYFALPFQLYYFDFSYVER